MENTENQHVPYYALNKTVLRGRIHQVSCAISILWLLGFILRLVFKQSKRKVIFNESSKYSKIASINCILNTASKIFILFTQAILYGFSSLYHLTKYNKILQKLDHFCIFLFISAVHTSVLLGMKQIFYKNLLEKEKKEKDQKKIKEIAKALKVQKPVDCSFRLHPNPFSMNSPMPNPSNKPLSDSGDDFDTSRTDFIEKTIENDSMFEKSHFDKTTDPTTDLSKDLTSLSENKSTASSEENESNSENETDLGDVTENSIKNRTIEDKSRVESTIISNTQRSVKFDESHLNNTSICAKKPLEQSNLEWTCTDFDKSNIQTNSYDSSFDTTVMNETLKNTKNESKLNETNCEQTNEEQSIAIRWPLIITWAICFFGFLKVMLQSDINELLDVPLYIFHGFHIVWTCQFKKLSSLVTKFFATGGAFYIIGGIFFGIEAPHWTNQYFGYHEFFHVMTVCGNTCFLLPIVLDWQLIE